MKFRKQPSLNCRNTKAASRRVVRHVLDQRSKAITPGKCPLLSIDAIGPRDCAAMDRVLFGRHIELCTELLLRQAA
jgi:hypothetical protein